MKLGYTRHIYVGYFLNFHRATDASLIQNQSYQRSTEKTKNNGEHKRQH